MVGNPCRSDRFQKTRREIFSVAFSTVIFASQDSDWDADVDGARNRWRPTLTKLHLVNTTTTRAYSFWTATSTIHPRNGLPAQLEAGAPASPTTYTPPTFSSYRATYRHMLSISPQQQFSVLKQLVHPSAATASKYDFRIHHHQFFTISSFSKRSLRRSLNKRNYSVSINPDDFLFASD